MLIFTICLYIYSPFIENLVLISNFIYQNLIIIKILTNMGLVKLVLLATTISYVLGC